MTNLRDADQLEQSQIDADSALRSMVIAVSALGSQMALICAAGRSRTEPLIPPASAVFASSS
jgi:hypothetical protein